MKLELVLSRDCHKGLFNAIRNYSAVVCGLCLSFSWFMASGRFVGVVLPVRRLVGVADILLQYTIRIQKNSKKLQSLVYYHTMDYNIL